MSVALLVSIPFAASAEDAKARPPGNAPVAVSALTSTDINTAVAGKTAPVGDDGLDVDGSGADIWDNRDGFRFVHASLRGDFDLRARIDAIENTDPWAKGGVMVRQDASAGSVHATMVVTPDRKFAFQRRESPGAQSLTTDGGAATPPSCWVRLARTGGTIRAYRATDAAGESWTEVGTVSLTWTDPVLVGLCVSSHKDGTTCKVRFRGVRLQAAQGLAGDNASGTPPKAARAGADVPDSAGAIKPGGLSDAEKVKRVDELRALSYRRDPRKTALLAAQRDKERKAQLSREHGVYDMSTLLHNGDSTNRVDIVIVTAGFPKADEKKVAAMTENLKAALLKVEPFKNYPAFINIHRVLVDDVDFKSSRVPISNENGAIHADYKKALDYGMLAPDCDLAVVLCNITGVRATGGGAYGQPGVITIDAKMDLGRTFLHEMGHAFATLSDEYVDKNQSSHPIPAEDDPWGVNVTRVGDPKQVKWHYWIPPVWKTAHQVNPLPKGCKVGCYEGAVYREKGVYRPENECLMRHGMEYCAVCFEQVEKRFYLLIAPIDDARPDGLFLHLWLDESVTLEADAIRTAAGAESIGTFFAFWSVDGKERKATTQKAFTTVLQLSGSQLGPGPHEAGLRVDFANRRVRRDNGWLSSSRAWSIDVGRHPKPEFKPVAPVQGQVGKPVEFEVSVPNPDPATYKLEAADLPPGAVFKDGRFRWTPEKAQQGAWRPRFVLGDGHRSVEKIVGLAVVDPAEKNYAPVLVPLEPLSVREEEPLSFGIEAVDVDGDHLVYTATGLPAGATLGVYDGVLRWMPDRRHGGGREKIAIEVSDGSHVVKGTVELVVEDRSIRLIESEYNARASAMTQKEMEAEVAQIFRRKTEYGLEACRSCYDHIRVAGFRQIKDGPRTLRILEAARLLRDRAAEVRGEALTTIQKLAESSDEAYLGLLVRDLAPHAWDFSDDADTLQWLQTLAEKGPPSKERDQLKTALKEIDRYNKDRSATR
jgi:hypothetical protein